MKDLVIVESPTKARTLSQYLGKSYNVLSSKGHVRDLPKSKLGVDVEKDFEPQFRLVHGKGKIVKELKENLKDADTVWLATDLDREGEAIAWHLKEVLELPDSAYERVTFHEITKTAIENAFESPGQLNINLVEAQKARRILDRLVGYKLSPLLWKKIQAGLSAGRVQSVAVRFVVEREREREEFSAENYWTIEALVASEEGEFGVDLRLIDGDNINLTEKKDLFSGTYQVSKTVIDSEEAAEEIRKELQDEEFTVVSVETKTVRRKPYPPFITSSLQTAAASLGFSSSQTMRVAQRLYEEGLITYHRTDSRFLSPEAVSACRSYVKGTLGEDYLPAKAVGYQSGSETAQEAHEAIRPTDFSVGPGAARKLGSQEERLYELIWRQTIACQMRPAEFSRKTVDVEAGKYGFRGVGQTLTFDGWLKVRPRVRKRYKESDFPPVKEGQMLNLLEAETVSHQTSPPPRYSEAALIKELKKNEIGRPSTYAPIIYTIQSRGYVEKEDGYFFPTDIGRVVNKLLVEHFPKIVDVSFTAEMEERLDEIAQGDGSQVEVLEEFWEPFSKKLEKKEEELKREDFKVLEETEEKCPECGENLVIKLGKYGKFYSCSNFPDCKYARPYSDVDGDNVPDKVDEDQLKGECPECGGELQLKEGRFGKFIACSNYPDCDYTKDYKDKIGMKCPECGEGDVIVKKTRKGKTFYGCSRYPDCEFASWKNPKEDANNES